jgi:phage-related minor tail protein
VAGRIKGITIEIGADVQPLNKALEGVNKKSRDIQKELRQVERLLKLDPGNTELVAQKQKLLADAVTNTKQKLETLKEAQKQVQEQYERGEIGEEQYRALQREIVKTEQDLKKYEQQLASVTDTTSKWEKKLEAAGDKLKKTGEKISGIGDGLSKYVTVPITGIAAASHMAWKEVDEALDTITTKTGATGEAAKGLEQAFKNVAKSVPNIDLQMAGDAIGEVNTQFGLTGKTLEEASKQALQFSIINGQDVSKTAIDARRAIEAYGLSTSDLGMVLDAVTQTAQDTGQATDALFDRVTKGAPQLKALNLDFAQAVAVMGSFEQAGVDSSKALSYLSRAQVGFAKEGKTLEQGLAEIVKKMRGASSETEALTIAAEVFGTKGATFMYDAIQRGALSLEDLENAAANAAGSVGTTFEATLDPVDKFSLALNAAKLIGGDLSATAQEALLPVIEKLVDILIVAADWFDGLSDGAKRTIVAVGGLAWALGPALMTLGRFVGAIGNLIPLISKLTALKRVWAVVQGILNAVMAANPIALIVIAIAALIAIIVLLIKNWDSVMSALKAGWEWLEGVFKKWWEGFSEFWIGLWNSICETVVTIWDTICTIFQAAIESIKEIIENLKEAVFEKFNAIKTTIIENILNALGWVEEKFRNFITFTTDTFNRVKEAIMTPIRAVVNFITTQFNNIVSFLDGVRNKIIGVFDRLKTGILGLWSNIFSGIKGFINQIIRALNGMISGMNKLKWNAPDWVPIIGGKKWGINIPLIPTLHKGTRYFLPPGGGREGLALLERGEQVIPRGRTIPQEVRHSGTIRVEGVNDAGQLTGVVDIVLERLLQEVRA